MPAHPLQIAYIMSRFPKITETFILYEMVSAERQGARIEVYPLWREKTRVMHEEARSYVARAHFLRLISWTVLASNLWYLGRHPVRYCGAIWEGLRATWGSSRYFFGFLATFPKAVAMGRDMRRRGIQHVHAHFASHPAAAALVIHHLFGIPFSFTAHGSDLHRDVHMLPEKVRSAAFVVAISQYNREVILKVCGKRFADKVRVIHCGTDTRLFSAPPREHNVERRKSIYRLTCIGTLHEVKGQKHLLQACAVLRDRNVQFELHLIGDGPDYQSLTALARQFQLQHRVVFHGRQKRESVAAILADSDLVVAPSVPTRDGRREGIPVALMEAMAAGVPVVASRISGIPELVEDGICGRLVTAGNASELADAIEQLLQDRQARAAYAQAACEKIHNQFDLHRNTQQLLQAIRSALPGSSPPTSPGAQEQVAQEEVTC